MTEERWASVVINNYNYGRFLGEAIDSALAQTYPHTEVIVVDDGSTDDSRQIIERYGSRITPVLKENGGQASAFNAGFAASRGEVVIFLDSDDVLLPSAMACAVEAFDDPGVAKVHWPLYVVDEQGKKTGQVVPCSNLPQGDLRESSRLYGPSNSVSPPTSGNAFSRCTLQQLLPIPKVHKLSADAYLFGLAPAFGPIKRVTEPQGYYRIHGHNNYAKKSLDERIEIGCLIEEKQWSVLANYFNSIGITADPAAWKANSWFYRLHAASREIEAIVPAGETVILVDGNEWATDEIGRSCPCIPFPEKNGQYWGPPPDDETAIQELERLRNRGATFMIVTWSAAWWLSHYRSFNRYLRSQYDIVLENDRLVVANLRTRDT